MAAQRRIVRAALMEKIVSKSNDVLTLNHRPLADSALDAVSGGAANTCPKDAGPFTPCPPTSPSSPPVVLIHEPVHT